MKAWHWWVIIGALVFGALVWRFWESAVLLVKGGTIIEDDNALDEEMEDIPLTKSESQRIRTLLPQVQRALQDTINDLSKQGIKVLVGQTSRTSAQVAANLKAGTSATTKSWHVLNRAADVYPIDPATDQPDMQGKNIELFRKMHQTAAKYGFTNIAFYDDWSKRLITTSKGKIWDGGHMQFTQGLTWSQAKAIDDNEKEA